MLVSACTLLRLFVTGDRQVVDLHHSKPRAWRKCTLPRTHLRCTSGTSLANDRWNPFLAPLWACFGPPVSISRIIPPGSPGSILDLLGATLLPQMDQLQLSRRHPHADVSLSRTIPPGYARNILSSGGDSPFPDRTIPTVS